MADPLYFGARAPIFVSSPAQDDEIHPMLGHPDASDWSHFNQPFGSISPTTPTPSERLANAAVNALTAAGMQPYRANHIVNGVGSLLGMTPVAAPIFAADLIDAKNRGDIGGALQAGLGMLPGAHGMDIPATVGKLKQLASDMGYKVAHDTSNLSRSEYLTLTHPALGEDADSLKIRISDHSLPPSYPNHANMEVGPHGEAIGWADAVAALSRRIGAPVPNEAASQLAADAAERQASDAIAAQRSAAEQANLVAKRNALANAEDSPNASRIAELQERLNDPSVTGNQRKKLNAKLRDALGYRNDPEQ